MPGSSAVAYLVVVSIHYILFSRSPLGNSARAIRVVVPFNYGASALLFLAAAVGERWGWLCWVLAVSLFLSSIALRQESTLTIRVGHFAERHRLLIIIALGETIIAVGVSSQGHLTEPSVFGVFALSMMLISGPWWVYFGVGDDTRAVEALVNAPVERRTAMASVAHTYTHMIHIAGLVLVAVSLHDIIYDPGHQLSWGVATTLPAGVAAFLVAQAQFRSVVGNGGIPVHLATALFVLAGIPLGVSFSVGMQLAFVAVVVAACAAILQVAVTQPVIEDGEALG